VRAWVEVDEGDPARPVVRLAGEVDMVASPALADRLQAAVPERALGLVVDLSLVTYLDAHGAQLLVDLAGRLGRRRQRLALVAPGGAPVRRVLETCDVPAVAALAGGVAPAREALG
jgi:anti-anti-sigma factor